MPNLNNNIIKQAVENGVTNADELAAYCLEVYNSGASMLQNKEKLSHVNETAWAQVLKANAA